MSTTTSTRQVIYVEGQYDPERGTVALVGTVEGSTSFRTTVQAGSQVEAEAKAESFRAMYRSLGMDVR